jgi:hypothetical protein
MTCARTPQDTQRGCVLAYTPNRSPTTVGVPAGALSIERDEVRRAMLDIKHSVLDGRHGEGTLTWTANELGMLWKRGCNILRNKIQRCDRTHAHKHICTSVCTCVRVCVCVCVGRGGGGFKTTRCSLQA